MISIPSLMYLLNDDEVIDDSMIEEVVVPTLLLVDLSYICHRGIQSQGEGAITIANSVYNALRLIFSVIGKYNCTEAMICTDTTPYQRRIIVEDYKGDRGEMEEDALDHLIEVKQIVVTAMMQLNTPVIIVPGAEADDLIAHFVKSNLDKRVVVLSSDGDLHALQDCHNNLVQAYPTIGKGGEFTEINKNTLAVKYPEATNQFWKLTLMHIIGGGHNFGIQIPQVGEGRAWTVITQLPTTVNSAREALDWFYTSLVRFPGKIGLVKAFKSILETNYQLNQFPLPSLNLDKRVFPTAALNLDNLNLMAIYLKGNADLVPASVANLLEKCYIAHDIDIKQ